MAIAGKSGTVYVAASGGTPAEALDVQDWSLTISADSLDTTSFTDSGWKTFLGGLKGYTGSVTAKWNHADTNQAVFFDNLGSSIDFKFYLDEANTKYFSGTAIVTSVDPKVSVSGTADVTFNLQGTGSITYNTV